MHVYPVMAARIVLPVLSTVRGLWEKVPPKATGELALVISTHLAMNNQWKHGECWSHRHWNLLALVTSGWLGAQQMTSQKRAKHRLQEERREMENRDCIENTDAMTMTRQGQERRLGNSLLFEAQQSLSTYQIQKFEEVVPASRELLSVWRGGPVKTPKTKTTNHEWWWSRAGEQGKV